jgi:foldase protein PrsA
MVSRNRAEANRVGATRPRSRRRPSRKRERAALVLGIVALLVIIAIPAAGYVVNFVLPPRQTVVQVNDTRYTLGDIVKLLRVFQRETEATGGTMNLGVLPFQVVNTLAENELMRQGAARENLTVTPQRVDDEIRLRILGPLDPEAETTQEELDLEFKERYRRYLSLIQLSEDEHRDIVLLDLYREVLQETLGARLPARLPHVHLYKVTVKTEEDAEEVRTEFARGARLADLVEQYDGDAEAIRKEGEVGWTPIGINSQLDPLIFDTLEVGELSDPQPEIDRTTNELSLVMYLVTERDDEREVTDTDRETLKRLALAEWMAVERELNQVRNNFNSDQYEWVVKQLQLSAQQ